VCLYNTLVSSGSCDHVVVKFIAQFHYVVGTEYTKFMVYPSLVNNLWFILYSLVNNLLYYPSLVNILLFILVL